MHGELTSCPVGNNDTHRHQKDVEDRMVSKFAHISEAPHWFSVPRGPARSRAVPSGPERSRAVPSGPERSRAVPGATVAFFVFSMYIIYFIHVYIKKGLCIYCVMFFVIYIYCSRERDKDINYHYVRCVCAFSLERLPLALHIGRGGNGSQKAN